MRVLGFISGFDELAGPGLMLGRKVANAGMVSALLRHADFDQLHFFLPFAVAVERFKQGFSDALQPGWEERVRLFPAAALGQALRQYKYHAMHAGELDRYFPELCHLRNRVAPEAFPVTCTPHSLSYWSTQVRNLYKVLPGPMPYDAIFCTSRAARDMLGSTMESAAAALRGLGLAGAGFKGRLEICPLGVDAASLAPMAKNKACKKLGLEQGPVTYLTIGRLSHEDKFDLFPLLGAFSLVCRKMEARLILAGSEGPGYGKALQKAAEGMGLSGRVEVFADFAPELKPALLGAADVFVSPVDNLQETFGLSIVEAMAAGLPVAASDFSGYRDLVMHGETGFLVPTVGPGDYTALEETYPLLMERVGALQVAQRTAVDLDALAGRMMEMGRDGQLRRRMGEAGAKRVAALFDWQPVVRRMCALWDELKQAALAQGLPKGEPDVLAGGLSHGFAGFPARSLSAQDELKPGPFREAFAKGGWGNDPHPNLFGALRPELIAMVAAEVERAGSIRAGDLARALGEAMPPFLVEHLVLHALKYGVLSLANPRGEE